MRYASESLGKEATTSQPAAKGNFSPAEQLSNWEKVRTQLLLQWTQITPLDLDYTGADCQKIAQLIEKKYGISCEMAELYLRNFEKTVPLL